MSPARLIGAGFVYFAVIIALGFVLGTIRTIFLTPALGQFGAVLLELPVMLTASWIVCGVIVRDLTPAPSLFQRAVMGASAFAFLMSAEIALALFVFGETPAQLLAGWAAPAGMAGLCGQIAFAVFPVLVKGR
ncbi:MAG: hypothetical protein RIA71_12065 [Oceanicaulis sp.]